MDVVDVKIKVRVIEQGLVFDLKQELEILDE
jgi:hypothetical protein